jgi:hypothetical protein
MIELKINPCQMCGKIHEPRGGEKSWSILCTTQGEGDVRRVHAVLNYESRELAIQAWNEINEAKATGGSDG